MRKSAALFVFLVLVAGVFAMSAGVAVATPSRTGACAGCHSGVNVAVSTTLVSAGATSATYSFSAPTGDAVAVFDGPLKVGATISATSGQFTVPVGKTYTVYAVRGPGTSSGIGSTSVSPVAPPVPPEPPVPPVEPVTYMHVEGATRFETAIQASKQAFPTGLDPAGARTVIIATGRNWPDALGGTSLAGALDCPVLLVDTLTMPGEVMAEMLRLGAAKAIILGGESAVGAPVEMALTMRLGAGNVERIAGGSRYETADAVARRVITTMGAAYDGTAFVATGANFPDALAAAPLAAAKGWPLFLADPAGGLSANTISSMAGVNNVIILGGTGVVTQEVETALKSSYGTAGVQRLSGSSRYATAVAVATYGVDHLGMTWDGVGITTGEKSPDALAGGVMQGKAGSVMLLTRTATLEVPTRDALMAHKTEITSLAYFGGQGALSQPTRDAITAVLQ